MTAFFFPKDLHSCDAYLVDCLFTGYCPHEVERAERDT